MIKKGLTAFGFVFGGITGLLAVAVGIMSLAEYISGRYGELATGLYIVFLFSIAIAVLYVVEETKWVRRQK